MKKNTFTFYAAFTILFLAGACFFHGSQSVWASSVFSDGAFDDTLDESSDGIDITAEPQTEFSDEIFTDDDQTSPEELFTEGESETETEFFSDSVPELSGLPDLLGEGAVPAENSIEVSSSGTSLGHFSSLDEALLQVTDPGKTYDIYLQSGVYEFNGELPPAVFLQFHGCNSQEQGTVISINAASASLNSNVWLDWATLYFSAPQCTLDMKNHILTISGSSLISSRLEEASDRLTIIGDSNSTITTENTSMDAGIYGAELRIGRLQTGEGSFIIASDNASHAIGCLELHRTDSLCFSNTPLDPSSENTVTFRKLAGSYRTNLIFSERFHCTMEDVEGNISPNLIFTQIADSPTPQWGTITFGSKTFLPENIEFQYIIESEQDFDDMGQAFFGKSTGSIQFPAAPGKLLQIYCLTGFDGKVRQQQTYVLMDEGTGIYRPNINYNFYYGDVTLANIPIPKLNEKVGPVSFPIDNIEVLRSEWISPKGLSVFSQGETYLFVAEFANPKDTHGLFTDRSKATLTLGKKVINGTVQVSEANTLTVQFSYTIDRITSLSVPKLKKATSINGTTISISWGKVKNASGYRIFRKTAKGSWKRLATISKASAVSYRDTKARPGVTYYYTVRPFHTNKDGSITWGKNNTKGISAKAVILAPKLVRARITANGMEVRWKQAIGATSYRVYRRTATSRWKYLGTVDGSVIGVYDNSFRSSGTYYYTVRGMYGKTLGKVHSKGIKATVPKLSTPKLTNTFWDENWYPWEPLGGYAGISWNPVKYAQYYKIYRRDAGSSKWKCLAVQPASEGTSYHDYDASPFASYYYTVRPFLGLYRGPCNSTGIYLKEQHHLNLS